ncbi:carbon-nitrogen hydrolase family protein [Methylocystis sp. S23]
MESVFPIATAQSIVTSDVRKNGRHIRDLMSSASEAGCRLAHFPEGALSGYIKSQIENWAVVDWKLLREELVAIAAHAAHLGLWTVIGCNHRLTPPHPPHNSLYVISHEGRLVGRYDKRLCSNTELADWYTPGRSAVTFDVDGVRFGMMLCIEVQFPELFLEYGRMGVDCVLFSAYSDDPMFRLLSRAHAATNNFWLSLSIPALPTSRLSAGLIGPDGALQATASEGGKPSLVCGGIDKDDPRFDIAINKARPWRAAARAGGIYTERLVTDARSDDRLSFFDA